MKTAIDLYSGIGGWTLGMKLSGIENLSSFEWWNEANQTHNLNFNTNHQEVNIRLIDVAKDLVFDNNVDFVVGSPPCTQFSFANKGGNGDIDDGLIDIYKFLEIVEYLNPTYWAMENIPRVADILKKELMIGSLKRFNRLVKVITVVDAADFGLPQNRKRMLAGNFPVQLLESYKFNINKKSLGDVMELLENEIIVDPNYGYKLPRHEITELGNEVNLTSEEERINRDAKTYHPVYNKMSFPDKFDRPSRTITATCTRVSRESIIVNSGEGFRRLNVREKAVLQGFPITYQFYGRTLNAKFKMIGNAIPPILTYYIFQSMLGIKAGEVKLPEESNYFHQKPELVPYESNLGLPTKQFPTKRSFQFSVPNLRYGSGVRFELSNSPKSIGNEWSFKFFYGNSKNIKQIVLNQEVVDKLNMKFNNSIIDIFKESINKISKKYKLYNSERLQVFWTAANSNMEVFNFLDDIGMSVKNILGQNILNDLEENFFESLLNIKDKKMEDYKRSILIGLYLLSSLNVKIF